MALSPTPPPEPGPAARGRPRRARRRRPAAAGRAQPQGVRAFLPNDLDPTVFDEGFLRQLERLGVLMKQPVRGGLKGGRRSVKRGQSVEFADYRDYSLGDDLRQLDWNVYARLEKLFVKLFVEEEDVTITFLLDASPSMAFGTPRQAAVREAGRRGARATSRSPARTAWSPAPCPGARPAATAASAASGRVFRLLGNLSGDPAPARPHGPPASSARHAAAMLSGRGVVVLLSDLLDPSADRVIRELAATGLGADRPAHPLARGAGPAARGRPAPRRQRDRRGRST